MKRTLAMLLAGGVGSRLNILAHARAKPAVPFGGLYRIIDFTLSNARNSGIVNVGVLTQYKPLSLMEHIGGGEPWDFVGRMRGAKILPPRTGEKDSDWYKGTADAIRQNLDYIRNFDAAQVLILSGDHIYHMDYSRMVDFHRDRGAELTIAMMRVPWEATRHFGIATVDDHDRILTWEEKPKQARSNLASMGVYVFNTDFLYHCLRTIPEHDFGKHIITEVIQTHTVCAYPFSGYWRDVGTLLAYWDANMDLLRPGSGLDLPRWKVYTNLEEEGRAGDRPPTRLLRGAKVSNSIISQGCVIEGEVRNSVLSPGVRVGRGAVVSDSVVMHDSVIEPEAALSFVIADKLTHFRRGCRVGFGDRTRPNRRFPDHLREGLTVVGKLARVPANVTIGCNCIIHPQSSESSYHTDCVKDGETIGFN
ncbi:MAG: sugar phosphate nucleotidyltransferase [candidate division KSB1 bacterium]|nr:sugar phosphate nucleotidyltransferase [candidate division KSB1 bacterium]MDZ7288140.1 sugar phosphate nucleotidyltransferase [candidate division KSB1 bacterium]MDZ7300347.1 sugar phosphate nucleotidyltransferase [candidate division KSB1 bacterium]MDZ7306160.1 sugar phosphate nucleotidyltransferase [candidate division KSB1 bacterium]MDZ7351347.1 sugar phosphate nucleotidyltransferase [candidate division KSB1 bacterium]